MKKLEALLTEEKEKIEQLEAPADLEERLKAAIYNKSQKKPKKTKWKLQIAAAILAILFIGYNADTLAFYGKKLIGYDDVMNGTLRELNELGRGQIIEKSQVFKNGVTVTLDGIMLDDNQLLAFYSIKDPTGNIESVDLLSPVFTSSFVGRHIMRSGVGEINLDKTEIKWITEFEIPYFYAKTLHFEFEIQIDGEREHGDIEFMLDRSKAMGHILKKKLNLKVAADKNTISFDSITAAPTATVIKGTLKSALELAWDHMNGERIYPKGIQSKLFANGVELATQGGGMSTNSEGITFEHRYDALPKDITSLELLLESYISEYEAGYETELSTSETDKNIWILGKNVVVNEVTTEDSNTYVTITSEDDIILSRVYLLVDGSRIKLKNTTTVERQKTEDGRVLHKRTLCFPASGSKYILKVDRITYTTAYNKLLEIPLD